MEHNEDQPDNLATGQQEIQEIQPMPFMFGSIPTQEAIINNAEPLQ
jgi:hypothetical protein